MLISLLALYCVLTCSGIETQPQAKLLSILFTLLTTVLYNLHLQSPPRGRVMHYLLYSYAFLFLLLSLLSPSSCPLAGYLNFVLTESYGSLLTAHFWAYCNAHIKEQAKSYPLIIALAQVRAKTLRAKRAESEAVNRPILLLAWDIILTR